MSISDGQAHVDPRHVAEELLGTIRWQDDEKGYCTCPGAHSHSGNTGDSDCIVYLNGAATIFCFHASCAEEVSEANQLLRSAIANGQPVDLDRKIPPAEIRRKAKEAQHKKQLELRARFSLDKLLKDYEWTFAEIQNASVDKPGEDVASHWRDIIGLFKPEDVIWIGNKTDSGSAVNDRNFKTAEQWLKLGHLDGQLTCPSVFKSTSFSRSNANVLSRRFLVVESDILSKNQVGAIFKWLQDEVGLNLRAIVDTAGKSLHGWFDYPKKAVLDQLEIVLPQLGCDKGLFTASQPCRIPGALRDGKYQQLVYLDKASKPKSLKLPSQVLPLPELYYDGHGQCYWRKNDHGGWQKINDSAVDTELMAQGYNADEKDLSGLTEVRQTKRLIQIGQDVSFAGPIAGYFSGLYSIQGQRVLVTGSPRIIKPCAGEWPILEKVINGLLVDETLDQRPYFYGWMKRGYQALVTGQFTPGQALCLAGPRDCGKSLLQLIITEILGGRSAKPYDFLTGATTFNADHFAGEHLMIEDDVASTDIRARRKLGAGIKNITVNTTQRCHTKQKTPLILTPFWRLSISLNDEPENLLILPPLDDSLLDKIMILKARMTKMPMPTETSEERTKFWATLMAELPAFLHFLEYWEVPNQLRSQRFGIVAFQHPAISEALTEVQPETRLLSIIDQVIFHRNLSREAAKQANPDHFIYPASKIWEGSAEDLESELTDKDCKFSREAQKLLYYSSACGTYLGRLQTVYPTRISSRKVNGKRLWTIKPVIL